MSPACRQLLDAIAGWRTAADTVLVVAIDGHGAAGKTTLSTEAAAALDAALLHTDDFYRDPGPGSDRHAIAAYYDWQALRERALAPLLRGETAAFTRGVWVAPGPPGAPVAVEPAGLILLEGVSAGCRPLSDLVHRRVLLDTDAETRRRRLAAIWSTAEWDHDWLAAEAAYLATQPSDGFDLILGRSTAPQPS